MIHCSSLKEAFLSTRVGAYIQSGLLLEPPKSLKSVRGLSVMLIYGKADGPLLLRTWLVTCFQSHSKWQDSSSSASKLPPAVQLLRWRASHGSVYREQMAMMRLLAPKKRGVVVRRLLLVPRISSSMYQSLARYRRVTTASSSLLGGASPPPPCWCDKACEGVRKLPH